MIFSCALPAKALTFLLGAKKERLQKMIDSGNLIAVYFDTYDWGTNALDFVPFEKSLLTANERNFRRMSM